MIYEIDSKDIQEVLNLVQDYGTNMSDLNIATLQSDKSAQKQASQNMKEILQRIAAILRNEI